MDTKLQPLKREQLQDKAIQILNKVLDKNLEGVSEVDMLLTGGYDSRLIAMLLAPKVILNTFTTTKYRDNDDDKDFANLVAKQLNIPNTYVDPKWNLIKSSTWFPPTLVKEIHKSNGEIVFDSIGGDALLRGIFSNESKMSIVELEGLLEESFREFERLMNLSSKSLEGKEVVFPFMDKEFVEFALTIPIKMKESGKFYTEILYKVNTKCARLLSTRNKMFFNLRRHSLVRRSRDRLFKLWKSISIVNG